METLPKELLHAIASSCNFGTIMKLQLVCSKLRDFIKDSSLLLTVCKMQFPRISGKAETHYIEKGMIYSNKDLDIVNGDVIVTVLQKMSYDPFFQTYRKISVCEEYIFFDCGFYALQTNPKVCQALVNKIPIKYWGHCLVDLSLIRDQLLKIPMDPSPNFMWDGEIYYVVDYDDNHQFADKVLKYSHVYVDVVSKDVLVVREWM